MTEELWKPSPPKTMIKLGKMIFKNWKTGNWSKFYVVGEQSPLKGVYVLITGICDMLLHDKEEVSLQDRIKLVNQLTIK